MKHERRDDTEQLLKAFRQCSEETQKAITWIVCNYDVAEEFCRNNKMTLEERKAMMESAKDKDHLLFTLLKLQEILEEHNAI